MSVLEISAARKGLRNGHARSLRKRTIMAMAQLFLAIIGFVFAGATSTTVAAADARVSSTVGPCGNVPGFCL